MGNLVVIGLGELQPLFGAYKQFVGGLWNVFADSDDRRSLWNGTLKALINFLMPNSLV